MVKDNKTYEIIGAAMKVHQTIGCGFLESVYQEALHIEFTRRNIPHTREQLIQIYYDEVLLEKSFQADFVCHGKIILEIKAVSDIENIHRAQLLNYLRATHLRTGLLINFGTTSLQYERFVL